MLLCTEWFLCFQTVLYASPVLSRGEVEVFSMFLINICWHITACLLTRNNVCVYVYIYIWRKSSERLNK